VLLKELRGPAKRIAKGEAIDKHPALFTIGISILGGDDVLAGPDLRDELTQMLFPTTRTLTVNQEYDIEHLRLHVRTGGDAFITKNTNDFINNGKQEKLAQIGIWVFTPAELVGLLQKLYNWLP